MRKDGFSMLEVIIALAIFSLIAVALSTFQRDLWVQNSFIQNSIIAESEARGALKTLIAELRAATPGQDGSYALATASSTEITFFVDIDKDGDRDRVRYFVQGNDLMKGLIRITSLPAVYSTSSETVHLAVHDLTNVSTGIFKYYDDDYDGVTATSALPFPVNIAAVRLIGAKISIDADPVRSPLPMSFESKVMIRNLKDNL